MNPTLSNPLLIRDVINKRGLALTIDACVIFVICLFVGVFLGVFGLLTLGFAWKMFVLMPLVPFSYHFVTLARFGGTPGQKFCGLSVRRFDDLGRPSVVQALIFTLGFYFTMMISWGVLLLVALVTEGKRTLHDMASGLIVVRSEALERASFGVGSFRV